MFTKKQLLTLIKKITMYQLRDYQEKVSKEIADLITQRKVHYLNGQVRLR
jgi:hypothetical protein